MNLRTYCLVLTVFVFAGFAKAEKVICYYDSLSEMRQGQGKFELRYLDDALPFCTHLIYGYAGINPDTYKLVSLDENREVSRGHFKEVTDLKKRFPGLQVFLSVGGFHDEQGGSDKNVKYRTLIESVNTRSAFVESAKKLLKDHGFDGLDLGWEFPQNKPKVIRGAIGGFFHNLKTKVVGESVLDDKTEAHREQFTALVRELKNSLSHENIRLSLSVLPNVNSSVYYNIRDIAPNIDLVIIHAYDFYTPERNPEEADFPAPLYEKYGRKFDENADYQVRYWLAQAFPNNKLVLAIPTYGRVWKMTGDSGITGVPPLTVDGPGEDGSYIRQRGILGYADVCEQLGTANPSDEGTHEILRYVKDRSGRYGTYAYRLPERYVEGIWVGYEDVDTVGNKAAYAKAKGLAGVALVDVTFDDFKGLCRGDKFPLLRAAKGRL